MIRVEIAPRHAINVQAETFCASVSVNGQFVRLDGSERYQGDYDVTPDFDTQTLDTDHKYMTDDVTVHPIPVHRTANPFGTTVYIGGILDG